MVPLFGSTCFSHKLMVFPEAVQVRISLRFVVLAMFP